MDRRPLGASSNQTWTESAMEEEPSPQDLSGAVTEDDSRFTELYPGDVTIKGHHWHLGEGAHLPDFFCETEGFSERQSNPRFKETKQTNSLPVL